MPPGRRKFAADEVKRRDVGIPPYDAEEHIGCGGGPTMRDVEDAVPYE